MAQSAMANILTSTPLTLPGMPTDPQFLAANSSAVTQDYDELDEEMKLIELEKKTPSR